MAIPTISLAPYFEALAEEATASAVLDADGVPTPSFVSKLDELVAAVRTACEEVGFFVIVDHGVDVKLLESQRCECAAFFSRPPQSLIMDMVQGAQSRFHWLDYVPPEPGDKTGTSAAWSLGPVQGRGSMPWSLDSEAMAKTWKAYYAAMEGLVAILMRLSALALGLPADSFADALRGHRSSLRAIFYPEVSEADLQAAGGVVVRSGEHSDWGCVTVLLADEEVGGLEVRGADGAWSPVPPVPGGLIVNLGDLLHRWTGGRWLATPHRVVARKETRHRRFSVPYFGLVSRKTLITPLVAVPEEAACAFASITAGEFFDRHEEYVKRQREASGGS